MRWFREKMKSNYKTKGIEDELNLSLEPMTKMDGVN